MRGKLFAALCLTILLANAHSFLFNEANQLQSKKVLIQNTQNKDANLQFINEWGSGVKEEHITTFKNAINSASSFYRDDDEKRLEYIADQMDRAYPSEGKKFAIYQDTGFSSQYLIFIDPDYMYASIAPGSDRAFPLRSYFFNRFNAVEKKPSFFTINGAKGEGITVQIEKQLLDAVSQADYSNVCECGRSMNSFMSSLPDWNYFCYTDSIQIMFYLYASADQYYALKGKNCFFAIFK